MSKAVIVKNLKKTYRSKKRLGFIRSIRENVEAIRGISFEIEYGEIVGLLGPNGAGKTTTIKILATLLLPDSGEAYVAGYSVTDEPIKVRENIGLMLTVEKGFFGKLTGRENLEYFALLYGLSKDRARERISYLIKLLELDRLGGDYKLFEEFSLGMKARLSLARSLLTDAPILLLDEPTLGLDPPSARKIRELVKELAHRSNKAVLYTTHNMFEAEIVCDRIILINKGLIVAQGTVGDLKKTIPKTKVINLTIHGFGKELDRILNSFSLKYSVDDVDNSIKSIKLYVERPEDILNDVIKSIVNSGYDIIRVNIEEPSLEDVFIYFSEQS